MTERIEPALTPEEWAEWQAHPDSALRLSCAASEASLDLDTHGLAALCLYQQPFGFTREDVEILTRCADSDGTYEEDVEPLRDLTARIAALLPPER
jgi:hypothetical protein